MERQTRPTVKTDQEIAYVFAERLLEAKRTKKADKIHSRALQEGRTTDIETTHTELEATDREYLESKRGSFTKIDRVRLVFQAKSKYLSGLSKEDQKEMYKEAGYADDEINKITGKKLLASAGLAQGIAISEHGARGFTTINDNMLPFTDNLPPNATGAAVAGSLMLYTGAYALLTDANLRLTKQTGTSANPVVTGLYFLSDKLLPNKARNWISKGAPITVDAVLYAVAYPMATLAATGEPNKIVAGTVVATGVNMVCAAAAYTTLGIKKKFQRNKVAQELKA